MKNLCTTLLLSFSFVFALQAQNEYNFLNGDDNPFYNPLNEYYFYSIENNFAGVNKLNLKEVNEKGKVVSNLVFVLNADEKVEQINRTDKKGNEFVTNYTFNEEVKKTSEIFTKNGKLKTTKVYNYNSENHLVLFEKKDENEKVIEKLTYNYNGKNTIASKRYEKGGEKIKNAWEYLYDAENKKTKSILYDGKGKVKHTWDYTCNDEGEQVTKKETAICKFTETADGQLKTVERITNEKGKVEKLVRVYTLDTLILAYEKYDANDVLLVKSAYNKSYKKPLFFENYRKGKLTYSTNYSYVDEKLVSMKRVYGKKQKTTIDLIYEYKDNKLVAMQTKRNEKTIKSFQLKYN